MSQGFYEGGYSGYSAGGGNAGGAGGGGYNNYNAGGGGSSDAFSGSMGSSMPYSQTQPMQGSSAAPAPSSSQQPQQSMGFNGMDGAFNLFNPALGSIGGKVAAAAASGKLNDSQAMMGMAETVAGQLFQDSVVKLIPGFERAMLASRPYFAVDNQYVKRKVAKVLFPFVFREWARTEVAPNADGTINYADPCHDENAPDLYIPSMSLLTYVLLCALCYGSAGKFDPEVLPDITTKCVATQILEVIAIRIGFYMMEAPVSIMDLFSYTSYKYLGLSVNMLCGLTMGHFLGYGHRTYYFTYLWTATAVSYFILKVMEGCIPRRTSAVGPKRQVMVLGFAASQFATCWFVSQTKFLE